jgi:N-acetylglucosamine-6-phosphate deacetylase
MSQMTGREPGLVGAALASDQLYCGIIADGHHVAWSNVKLSAGVLRCHLCLVTDAMRTLEGEETEFSVHGKKIRLQSGRLTDATGRLAGAHIAMDACVRNIINFAGVDAATAISMASTNPARVLKLDDQLGYVAPGYRASLSLLSDGYRATGVLVDGHLFSC